MFIVADYAALSFKVFVLCSCVAKTKSFQNKAYEAYTSHITVASNIIKQTKP